MILKKQFLTVYKTQKTFQPNWQQTKKVKVNTKLESHQFVYLSQSATMQITYCN